MFFIFLLIHIALAAEKIPVEPKHLNDLRASGKDEEFAKLLEIDVNLVRPTEKKLSAWSLRNTASHLGDILLAPEEKENARQGINFKKYPDFRWPNHKIPYVINTADFNSQQIQAIESTIANFNSKVTNLKLVPRRRSIFREQDYVYIFSGNGCYSYLGKRGNQQALSLQSNGCVRQGTIQHEFLHAAGIIHENSRPDRDDYLRLIPNNIPPQWRSQYQKSDEDIIVILGPYDYYSIMHYSIWIPTTGLPAFEVLRDGIDEDRIGARDTLTEIDILKINRLYS